MDIYIIASGKIAHTKTLKDYQSLTENMKGGFVTEPEQTVAHLIKAVKSTAGADLIEEGRTFGNMRWLTGK